MAGSLVLGFFDGVHAAHRVLIRSAIEHNDSNVTILTFKDSPALYFGKNKEYILTREESVKRIKNLGANVVEFDFPSIASMSAEDYLSKIVETYSPDSIFTGFNHTFGINKQGNPDFLTKNQEKYDYKYFCITPQKIDNEIVSSTFIKNCLKCGDIKKANLFLQENFVLEGIVIKGAQIGQKIGFPTANIKYPEEVVKIPFGVYKVQCDGKPAIMNWGMRPTVHNIKEPIAEIHILNFNGDLYGKNIRVEILNQIRSEKHFSNLEELKTQINKDIIECLK